MGSLPYLLAPSVPGNRNININIIRNGGKTIPAIKSHPGLFISCNRLTKILKLDTIHKQNITSLISVIGEVSDSNANSSAPKPVLIIMKTFMTLNMYNHALVVLVLKSITWVNSVLR